MDLPRASPESLGISSERLRRVVAWQQRLCDEQLLPFSQVVVGRRGRVCHFSTVGQRDLQRGLVAEPDTISRIFSMSKPIVSVALMTLYEEGRFLLSDPVHLYLGERWRKASMRVYVSGGPSDFKTEPCSKSITIRDVLTHTSGLTYGFDQAGIANKVDAIYARLAILQPGVQKNLTLGEFVEKLAEAPLLFQPGSGWNYGYNVEVVGRLCEVLSGMPLDDFLRQRLFVPLRMPDTGFVVPESQWHRFAELYMRAGGRAEMLTSSPGEGRGRKGLKQISSKLSERYQVGKFKFQEPGGGLVSTASDYARFCQMLLNGGELDGERVISRKTLDWMTLNHLDADRDMRQMLASAGYSETAQDGVGFGLGFSVVLDPALSKQITSTGTFAWGGAASTLFWCDPMEDLFVLFMTQFMYRDNLVMPLGAWLSQLVYGCLCDDPDKARRSLLPLRSSAPLAKSKL